MSVRPERSETASRAAGRAFFDTPLGWLVSLVAMGAFAALFFVSIVAAAVVAALLVAAEIADQLRKRREPWLVEATAPAAGRALAWRVTGRRASARVVAEVAEALARGEEDVEARDAERLENGGRGASRVIP